MQRATHLLVLQLKMGVAGDQISVDCQDAGGIGLCLDGAQIRAGNGLAQVLHIAGRERLHRRNP
nr:hypothetical protein [Sphingobium sp. Ant17]